MKPKKILDKMLDLTNELAKLVKKLEGKEESGPEWLTINAIEKAVNAIEKAVGMARTVFEQRLNNKET